MLCIQGKFLTSCTYKTNWRNNVYSGFQQHKIKNLFCSPVFFFVLFYYSNGSFLGHFKKTLLQKNSHYVKTKITFWHKSSLIEKYPIFHISSTHSPFGSAGVNEALPFHSHHSTKWSETSLCSFKQTWSLLDCVSEIKSEEGERSEKGEGPWFEPWGVFHYGKMLFF